MAADQATSVSKGVFGFKGKSKRLNEDDFLINPKDKGQKARSDVYHEIWEDLYTQVEILRTDLNCQIFDDLLAFVSGCHKQGDQSFQNETQILGEIPTAVLVTGVNTPDHDVMFSNLQSMLKSKMSPLVARVGSHDNNRINSLLSDIVAQLMNITMPVEEKEDWGTEGNSAFEGNSVDKPADNPPSPFKFKGGLKRKKALNLTSLVKWYKKTFDAGSRSFSCSPHKKTKHDGDDVSTNGISSNGITRERKSEREQPLVIIVFEDVENINSSVFQDFISLCSSYLASLPIVLILGIATAVTAIHQVLPSGITSLLCMEKFQAPPASQYLTKLMDKIIMTPDVGFKLGPKVFHFLLDTFLYHDFSILNLTLGLQYCLTQHCLTNPLSLLCSSPSDVDTLSQRLTPIQMEGLRKAPGFLRFAESFPDEMKNMLMSDNVATRKQLISSVTELHRFHKNLFPTLRFLHSLASDLPKHPLGKYFRELYSMCLTGDLCETDSYKQTLTFLRLMSLDDLCKSLAKALIELEDHLAESAEMRSLSEEMTGFVYRLGHLDEEQDVEEPQDTNEAGVPTERVLPQRAKLHELKEQLQSMSSKRRKSPYERLRDQVMACLESHIKSLIVCPLSLPLQDALYFNDLAAVKDQLKAAPRCSVQRALSLPGRYLKCTCCQGDDHSILPSMPDVCVVYKLHLECGTLVNLFDWMTAFATIVTAESKGKRSKVVKPTTELRARFIRAVSELQFLGFIKSTKRKTDHVTRLTW